MLQFHLRGFIVKFNIIALHSLFLCILCRIYARVILSSLDEFFIPFLFNNGIFIYLFIY